VTAGKIHRSMDSLSTGTVLSSRVSMTSGSSVDGDGPLTARELDVLRLVAAGEPSRVVAAKLGLTEATVKRHLYNIYRKLEVRNRVEATNWYLSYRRRPRRPR
jgi:DNA-binding NarL/FixJ family response regulator